MNKNLFLLNGEWTLQYGPQRKPSAQMDCPEIPPDWKRIPARVPGNVELDLVRAGELPADLERGHNIYKLRDLETHQWWYSRTFTAPALPPGTRCELVFQGVDTLASVWLNEKKIGRLENMLIPHRIDVTDFLCSGENRLAVGIDSTVLAAREIPVHPGEQAMENNWESLWIRKAPHMFGWDIMPRAVSAGLWREVSLEVIPRTRFRHVYTATMSVDVAERSAWMFLHWDIQTPVPSVDDWNVRVSIASASGETVYQQDCPVLCTAARQRFKVENIDLWWPRGYGRAALYSVHLELRDGQGTALAEWKGRHGFRTVALEHTDTTTAEGEGEFAFVVNGEKIFIKGTNWVPLDAFHSRDAGRLDETLDMVCDLNCNMIRCWGGNVYEDQPFFNRCDEEGIMVWQDFAFACALYPQTPAFHQKIREEAEALIPLLRNHPSLALWAGNNEIDYSYLVAMPKLDPNRADRISREILAEACGRMDPWRDYLPSSPYFSSELWKLGCPDDRRPEDHLWGPRDDFKGPYYRSSSAHFVSEIGYHGCPSRASLEKMMTPENLWPWQENDEWLTHAIRPQPRSVEFNYRLALMAHQISVLFGAVPEDLDAFIAGSQLSQAEALKFFIERFRIGKGRRTGILWWNVRDGWPQISDGVVDYYGSAKAAYQVIRRVQQDICVMLDEPVDSFHEVVAVNDTMKAAPLSVLILDGDRPLLAGEFTVPANGRISLGRVPEASAQTIYSIVWDCGGASFSNHYLAGPRPFDLAQCRQWYEQEGLLTAEQGGAPNTEGSQHRSGMVDRESREWTRTTEAEEELLSLARFKAGEKRQKEKLTV